MGDRLTKNVSHQNGMRGENVPVRLGQGRVSWGRRRTSVSR